MGAAGARRGELCVCAARRQRAVAHVNELPASRIAPDGDVQVRLSCVEVGGWEGVWSKSSREGATKRERKHGMIFERDQKGQTKKNPPKILGGDSVGWLAGHTDGVFWCEKGLDETVGGVFFFRIGVVSQEKGEEERLDRAAGIERQGGTGRQGGSGRMGAVCVCVPVCGWLDGWMGGCCVDDCGTSGDMQHGCPPELRHTCRRVCRV